VAFVAFVALAVGNVWVSHPPAGALRMTTSEVVQLLMPWFTLVLVALGLYKFVDGGLTIRKEIKARKAKEIEKRQEAD